MSLHFALSECLRAVPRRLRVSVAVQRRFLTVAEAKEESRRQALIQLLVTHHRKEDDPERDNPLEAAQNTLRWLEEDFDCSNKVRKWEILQKKVDSIVKDDEPIAYVIGNQPFYPLKENLLIRPPILIPRPETEYWVDHLSRLVRPRLLRLMASRAKRNDSTNYNILDIGVGSGCISLALLQHLTLPGVTVSALGVDASSEAVHLADENRFRCVKPGNFKAWCLDLFDHDFVRKVITDEFTGKRGFDLIVSNPPYITPDEYGNLAKSVKTWEDPLALVGKPITASGTWRTASIHSGSAEKDGLGFYRRIANITNDLLSKNNLFSEDPTLPVIALEVGRGQAQRVASLLGAVGFRTNIFKDQWEVDRLVLGYRKHI